MTLIHYEVGTAKKMTNSGQNETEEGVREIAGMILYKCNGKKVDCSKTNCYKNGGECRHTQDINYAESFHITECRNRMEGEKASHEKADTMASHSFNELP